MRIEIPKYIETGSWECDYSLERLVNAIEGWSINPSYEGEAKLQMNPDFQRGHVWTEKQQLSYVEALLSGGAKNAMVIYLNNPNWIQHSDRPYKDFVCVDGLQRYTAIKRFVRGEIKPYGYTWEEYNEGFSFRLSHSIKININDLPTRKDVLTWYLEMNSMGTPHTQDEIFKVKKMLDGVE